MTTDLRSLLQTNFDDVKAPVPLPAGSYRGIIVKYDFGQTKGENQTPFIQYTIQLLSACDDVDPNDLDDNIDWSRKQIRKSFYLTHEALYRFKEFVQKLGIDPTGRTPDSVVADTLNKQVLCAVTQKPDQKDPTKIYNEIGDITVEV